MIPVDSSHDSDSSIHFLLPAANFSRLLAQATERIMLSILFSNCLAALPSAWPFQLDSLSLVHVIFQPPQSLPLSPWPYFVPTS